MDGGYLKRAQIGNSHFSGAAAVAILEVLDSIGDTCPECPPG
jgi:hypothetical protein